MGHMELVWLACAQRRFGIFVVGLQVAMKLNKELVEIIRVYGSK